MPELPGNRVDSPIRGHRTRPAARESPPGRRPYRASIGAYVAIKGTNVKISVSVNVTIIFGSSCGFRAPSPLPLPHGERESAIVSVRSCIPINGEIKC
jgi:hypothetical protein